MVKEETELSDVLGGRGPWGLVFLDVARSPGVIQIFFFAEVP